MQTNSTMPRGIVALAAAALVACAAVAGCGGQSTSADRKTRGELGTSAHVTFGIACVDEIDYMAANKLSVYLEGYAGGAVDPAIQAIISSTRFGNTVSLLTSDGQGFSADYTLEPTDTDSTEQDGVTTFSFDPAALPTKAGVPYVLVTGKITPVATSIASGDGTTITSVQAAAWTAGTSWWPVADPAVQQVTAEAAGTMSTDSAKVEALWRWVRDEIEYDGPVGTRWGTLQVLRQRFGKCWDKADVFVTLCRAAGIPAREVAGWLNGGGGGGHVWAQAYITGEGWVSVDCTSDRVGADTRYVPFFETYDGAMPILYASFPTFN